MRNEDGGNYKTCVLKKVEFSSRIFDKIQQKVIEILLFFALRKK